ncbi:hypothetical protein P7C71_g4677, partial [Lecanoromycetidae sp. Uapishka_2]
MPFPAVSKKLAQAQIQEPISHNDSELLAQSQDIGGIVPNTYAEDGKVKKREPKPWAHLVAGGYEMILRLLGEKA